MKNWLINKLGGITNDEFEKFRINCENWTIKNLTAEAYLTCNSEILVIKSNVSINNTVEKTIKLAPWVRGLRLTDCRGLYFELRC